MKDNKEQALNDFLGSEESVNNDSNNNKNIVIDEREGLIERVDKVLVTRNGKQLLREQY